MHATADSNQTACFKTALYGTPYTAHVVDFIQPGQQRGYVVMRITNLGPLTQKELAAADRGVPINIKIESGCTIDALFASGVITYALFNKQKT